MYYIYKICIVVIFVVATNMSFSLSVFIYLFSIKIFSDSANSLKCMNPSCLTNKHIRSLVPVHQVFNKSSYGVLLCSILIISCRATGSRSDRGFMSLRIDRYRWSVDRSSLLPLPINVYQQ